MKVAKEVYMYILGALIVIGFFVLTAFFLFKEMPAINKDIMLMLIGAMIAKFSDIVGYFFGSSKSSADKTTALTEAAKPEEVKLIEAKTEQIKAGNGTP